MFQSSEAHFGKEHKINQITLTSFLYSRPIFFVVEEQCLHILFISYFNNQSKQLKDFRSLSVINKLSLLVISWLS